jgi:hypothetical protein
MTQIIFMKIYRRLKHEKKRDWCHILLLTSYFTLKLIKTISIQRQQNFAKSCMLCPSGLNAGSTVSSVDFIICCRLSGNGREPIKEENILHNPRINANSSSK